MNKKFLRFYFIAYFAILLFAVVVPFLASEFFWVHFSHYAVIATLFCLGILALTYTQAELFRARRGKKSDQQKFTAFTSELIDTYKHMGTVNRQLEMTKGLIRSSAIAKADINQQGIRNILQNILESAAFSIKAPWGLLRFVETKAGRTLTEFRFSAGKKDIPNVANISLLAYLRQKKWHQNYFFVIPDERERETVAFIVFPKTQKVLGADDSFLKIFVNQAQLIFLAFQDTIIKQKNKNAGIAGSGNNQKPA